MPQVSYAAGLPKQAVVKALWPPHVSAWPDHAVQFDLCFCPRWEVPEPPAQLPGPRVPAQSLPAPQGFPGCLGVLLGPFSTRPLGA